MKTRTFKRPIGIFIAGLLLLLSISPAYANGILDWSFSVNPSVGAVEGPPGSTVGWGYTITNPDPLSWLSPSGISADIFSYGAPLVLFDFPTVAPAATISVGYTPGVTGLYEITWDVTAPVGAVNSGTFILSADWYDGDPLSGGSFIDLAPDQSASYSATVTAAAVPEPSTLLLIGGGGLIGIGYFGRKRMHLFNGFSVFKSKRERR